MNLEDFEVFLEDFCDFLDSLEVSVVKMKMQIAKLVGVTEKQKWNWNPGKLTRDGVFYWVFKNGSTVGRKKREVKP